MPELENSAGRIAKKKKSPLGAIIRIVVSLGLAAFVYYHADRKGILGALQSVSWRGAVQLIVLYVLGQVLSAMKWRIFVEQVGIKRTPFEILRAYFLGMFVNVFGFGTVGGDVARALTIMPGKGERAAALATVVADRVHGLTVLLTIGTISICLVHPAELGAITPFLCAGSVAGVLALGLLWWFGPAFFARVFAGHKKWGEMIVRVSKAFPRHPKPFLTATFISALFHSIQLLMHVVIARELGAPLSAAYILATVPFVNIMASLPISILNGFGVREAMYRLMFVPAGVPAAMAVAFGTIWLCTVTLVSSVGILLLTPGTKKIIETAATEDEVEFGTADASVPRRAIG